MAIIDKKLIHFKKWNTFISSEGVNGNYTTPSTSATSTSPALYGQIKETSIVFIQDVQKIWTHGKLYDCSTPDLSTYLTAEDLATLNAFMNNSSVNKDGETLTVKINGSTQSLTNTWRSISDKTNGTSSTISASEKAVKAAYDLAASKTSNTGTVTSVTPGTGLTGTSSDAAITTSGTINLKTAGTSEIGGIKIGYSESGKNYPVQLDSDYKAYVYVPWTDNNTDTKNTAGSSNKTGSKLLLVGATSTTTGTTYTNSNCYVGTDNCLYSGGTKVLTSHQDISGKADKSSLATVATSGSYNDLTNKPTIPSAVTSSTVSGWGFTKNAGTITGITMNGASKGTSGVVDLGTVLTSHQDISGKAPNNHASTATTYGVATSGTSAKYGHVKLVSGNVNGQTYADGVAAAAAHTHSNYLTSHQDISGKQDKLTSGTNIKTINGQSVLGSGNITISAFADHGYTTDIIEPGLYKVIQESYINLSSITSHPNSIYTIYIEPVSDPLEINYPTNFRWCNDEPNFASIGDDGKVVELNILVLDDGSSSHLNTCLCTWAVFE